MPPPLGISVSLGIGLGTGGGGGGGGSTVLETVGVVGNTATLEAITGESEGFVAYNDETFALWLSSEHTTPSLTLYTNQDSGT